MGKAAVFLDRDGVLNEAIIVEGKPYPPKNIQELVIKPDAYAALKKLKEAGFYLFVVTNQPDVARGTTSMAEVESLNNALQKALPMIDKIYTCFHDNKDHCDCRKPLPGLFFQAQKEFDIDLAKSVMIGDRWRDIEAGRAAGCKNIWLDFGYDEKKPEMFDFVTQSLNDATDFILRRT